MEEEKLAAVFAGVEYDIDLLKYDEKIRQRAMQEMQSLLIDKFEEHVAKHPKRPFVIFDDTVYTYEAIDHLACRVANVAKTWKFRPGHDSVAMMIHNEPSFVYTFLGLQKLGIPAALINTNLTGQSLVHCLKSVESKAFIVGPDKELLKAVTDVLPELDKLPVFVQGERQQSLPSGIKSFDDLMKDAVFGAPSRALRSGVTPMDTYCYIFTSGTTGRAKPVFVSHARSIRASCTVPGMTGVNQDDVTYIVIPMYHSVGFLIGFSRALMSGSCVILRKKFSARHFWTDCRKHKATIIPYIGELLRYVLSQPKSELDGVHNVRLLTGSGLRADIWTEVVERFKIPKIAEFYGATEGLAGAINFAGRPGAVGRLSPLLRRFDPNNRCLVKFDTATALPIRDAKGRCVPVQIGEPGLLISVVPDQLKDKKLYKAGSDATEKKMLRDVFAPGDCYMNYGDAFVLDKDYFLYFYDRLGDTFRWKGENVSTKEVANVISSLSFVEDTNVYGVTMPGREGKAGMAAITLNPKAHFGNKELQELYTHVCKELPLYARPLFVRHLPQADMTGTFKNRKVDLAEEGYDLNKVMDPLYFIDHENQAYNPLTKSNLSKFIRSRL